MGEGLTVLLELILLGLILLEIFILLSGVVLACWVWRNRSWLWRKTND